jgi:acetyl-CoA synthetase
VSESEVFEDRVAWRPDEPARARAQLTRFLSACGLDSLDALHRRSLEDIAWFTEQVLRFLNIEFDPPYSRVVDLSRGPAWPRWCVDGGLNISRSCLDGHRGSSFWNAPAVIWEGEEKTASGAERRLTYAELHGEVEKCAAGLRARGLGKGDAVGMHLPMMPETVVALLALARIGAVAVPLFSGYGPTAIAARLQDVQAKALFTCDAFPRRGKAVPCKTTADEACAGCPELAHVIVVRRMGMEVPMRAGRDLAWEELLRLGAAAPPDARRAEPTDAEDPLLILYTSGTTGRPKGIVHAHCGFPVKAAQDMAFGTDVGAGDRISWVTDIGWMMGPWLIYGAALLGATLALYDGAPDYPDPGRLWDFCARHQVGILGISPSLIRALAGRGDDWPARHDLSRLRILASTGEPWNPAPWHWLFEKVGRGRLPIINYSGGTEISGGILMGNPLMPLKPCAFPAPCPGMAADVVDEQGRSVRETVGELVIRQPWIGMARGFWRDPERYLATYWSRWPGVWVHGDWARVDGEGHWYITGRSDDTLKIAGKRVGPAEVESILVGNGLVTEAAVIGVPDEAKGQAMIAFCVPASPTVTASPTATASPTVPASGTAPADLAQSLMRRVAEELGKPLRPEKIFFVPALPRTRNAKVMRRVIRAAYLGEELGDVTALENPAAVEAIRSAGREGKET